MITTEREALHHRIENLYWILSRHYKELNQGEYSHIPFNENTEYFHECRNVLLNEFADFEGNEAPEIIDAVLNPRQTTMKEIRDLDQLLVETLEYLGMQVNIPTVEELLRPRGHLVENATEEMILKHSDENNYWLLTEDGYLEFHGGGFLRNAHGEILSSYCGTQAVGSLGIETGLMHILNYASKEGAETNGKRSSGNYDGPYDRNTVIEMILDAGLNYYTKDDDIANRSAWSWRLNENLYENAVRRIKLPESVFTYYEQFEPGWQRVEGGFLGADYSSEPGNAKYHVGVDWVWRENNENKTIGIEILSTTNGIVIETGTNKDLGKYIRVLDSESNARIDYFHLSEIIVSEKQKVIKGDTILGLAGNTGIGEAHLHIAKSFRTAELAESKGYFLKDGDGKELSANEYIQYTQKNGATGRYYVTPTKPIDSKRKE